MKSLPAIILSAAFLAAGLAPARALADDADKAACASLDEGDDCTRGDGDPGVCIPDESDTNVLTCDDDTSGAGAGGSGGSDGSSDCSSAGTRGSSGLGFFFAALAGLAVSRRRLFTR